MRSVIPTAGEDSSPGSTIWAVCWQAAAGRDFSFHPSLFGKIRARLIDAHAIAGRELLDFLVVPTAIHIVVRIAEGDSVAGIAGSVGHVISRRVREVQPMRGPVFAERYRAEQMLSIDELRHEIRMLAWRPVVLGLCVAASHYPRGGLRTALGLTPSSGFDTRPLLDFFGRPVPVARAALRRLIKRRPSEVEWRAWEMSRGLVLATGNVGSHEAMARPVERSAALLIAAGGSYDVDGALDLLGAWISARIHPGEPLDLHLASTPIGVRGRALVACLAVNHGLCSAASVARYFGRSKSTLSEQIAVCRSRPADRHIVSTPLQRILAEVAALGVAGGNTERVGLTRSPPRGD
jgi:hypothetical protein